MKIKQAAGFLAVMAALALVFAYLQDGQIISHFDAPAAALLGPWQRTAELTAHELNKTMLSRDTLDAELSTEPSWDDFYAFIEVVTPCNEQVKFGGAGGNPRNDGSKMMCLDRGYTLRSGSCTVLSFGINNEWSFDDAMDKAGCKVYAFDPSMKAGDHIRGKNIHFFKLGISDSRNTIKHGKLQWKVDSYRGILNKINETDTVIDYLKIDVEGSELNFFANVLYDDAALLRNVKQIGMEIHPGRSEAKRDQLWMFMHRIQRLNFRLFFMEPNLIGRNSFTYHNKRVSNCFEVAWINENFKQ